MRAAFLLLIFTVVAVIGMLEFGVRWLYAEVGSTDDNTSYFAERWRAQHEGARNGLGFREREFGAPDPAVTRIAVVGDSVTYGQGLEVQERFTERLDEALGDDFEVLNFGVPGANYDRHRETMALAIDAAAPDRVILQWLFNDVQPAAAQPPRAKPLAGPLHRFVQPHSGLYFVANRGFTQLQYDFGLVASADNYFAAFADPAGAPATAARRRLEDVLDVAKAAAVPVDVVLWPNVTDRQNDFQRDKSLIAQVLDVCVERQLRCLDLTATLRSLPPEVPLVVGRYDGHPSAAVNAAAAAAARDWLMPEADGAADLLIDSPPGARTLTPLCEADRGGYDRADVTRRMPGQCKLDSSKNLPVSPGSG